MILKLTTKIHSSLKNCLVLVALIKTANKQIRDIISWARLRVLHKLAWPCLICFALISPLTSAQSIHVAVASNFIEPSKTIFKLFEQKTGHKVLASYGSSGKLYAQIVNGAPYQLFLSADKEKPEKLTQQGLALEGSIYTYALGQLNLFSQDPLLFKDGQKFLMQLRNHDKNMSYIAIANPKFAPYGQAAMEVLAYCKLNKLAQNHLVKAENIAQAYQFVASGNAQFGFVARSQIVQLRNTQAADRFSSWEVPNNYHSDIAQDMVLIKKNSNEAAQQALEALYEFIKSDDSKLIIQRYGYDLMGS